MRLFLVIVLQLIPAFAQAWPWSNDMANQISIKPQEIERRSNSKQVNTSNS